MRRVLILVALLSACGDDDGSGLPPGPYGEVMGAFCDVLARCPDLVDDEISYGSRTQCAALLKFELTCELVTNPDGSFDLVETVPAVTQTEADACAAALAAASCEELESGGVSLAACAAILSPPDPTPSGDALGETCEPYSCQSGLYCADPVLDATRGVMVCAVCEPLPVAGAPCSGFGCAAGHFCDYSVSPAVCAALLGDGVACSGDAQCESRFCNTGSDACDPGGAVGDACAVASDCRWGLYCDGVCAERKPNGAGCGDDAECSNGDCDAGTSICGLPAGASCSSSYQCAGWCDAASGLCAARKADGASCADADECLSDWCDYSTATCVAHCYSASECADDEFCDWSSNRCLAQLADGVACDDDDECLSGRCRGSTDTCAPPAALGDACSGSFEDCPPEGTCEDGVCVRRRYPGEECSGYDSCVVPYVCSAGRCRMINLECRPASTGNICAGLRVCDDYSYCDTGGGFLCEPRVGEGASCSSSAQCQGALYCTSSWRCAPRVGAGSPCATAAECVAGLYCVAGASGSTCEAGPVGQPCDPYDRPCPDGTFCSDGYPEVCVLPIVEGGECESWGDVPCADGLYCDTYDSYPYLCRGPRAEGEQCQSSDPVPCAAGLACDTYNYPYTCKPPLAQGVECASYGLPCAADLYCDQSTYPYLCQPAPTVGQACAGGVCAGGLYCDWSGASPICAAVKAAGQPCSDGDECQSGACDGSYGCLASAECALPE